MVCWCYSYISSSSAGRTRSGESVLIVRECCVVVVHLIHCLQLVLVQGLPTGAASLLLDLGEQTVTKPTGTLPTRSPVNITLFYPQSGEFTLNCAPVCGSGTMCPQLAGTLVLTPFLSVSVHSPPMLMFQLS